MRARDRLMEWAAGLLLPVLIALAGVLSYNALRSLAIAHGYVEWEADLWPLVVDSFALVAMLTAMVIATRRYGPGKEAWTWAAVSIAVTVAGNVLSAGADPIAQLMHAWPALALVAAWHLWTRYVSARAPHVEAIPVSPPPPPPFRPSIQVDRVPSVRPKLSTRLPVRALPAGRVTLDQYRAAVRELGPGATNEALAAHLGVTDRTVRRLRQRDREAGRPRVVSADR